LNFEINEELKKLKKKYNAVISYKIIPTILDKLNCDYLEIDMDDINKNESQYIVTYIYESNKVLVQKQKYTSNKI